VFVWGGVGGEGGGGGWEMQGNRLELGSGCTVDMR